MSDSRRPYPRQAPVTLDTSALEARLAALPDARRGATGREWTPEEDRLLLLYWPRKSKADMARLLGASRDTLRSRYRALTEDR